MVNKYDIMEDGTLLVRDTCGSRFGGVDDKEDSGISYVNFNYRERPLLVGFAAPIQKGGDLYQYRKQFVPFTGDNWKQATKGRIYAHETNRWVIGVFTDIGPSANQTPDRQIDLLNGTCLALGLPFREGLYTLDVRIFLGTAAEFYSIEPDTARLPAK